MPTVCVVAHPPLVRMRNPDENSGLDENGQRSNVALEASAVDRWLWGERERIRKLVMPQSMAEICGALLV
jgi:hypothetical protein